jgi:ribose-phosphate pyrophosphokinase
MRGGSILYTIRGYAALARRLADASGCEQGKTHAENWKDGELYQRVETPVRGRDAVLLAGTDTDAGTLEAYDLAFALIEQGARSLAILVPFFGYSTMERAWLPGEAVTAKSRARLWSALPASPWGIRFRILEPHTPGLPHYFGRELRVEGIDSLPFMLETLREFDGLRPVLCSPDTGRVKWVDALARTAGKDSAFVLKRRDEGGRVDAIGISGDLRNRHVILCDDMVRTGATLINASRACLAAGAAGVSAVAVHGAFVPGALREMEESGSFRGLIVTDSHPRTQDPLPGWVTVRSCASLLAPALEE